MKCWCHSDPRGWREGGEGEDVRLSVTELKEQDIDINLRPKIEDGKFASYRGSASKAVGRGRASMFPTCYMLISWIQRFLWPWLATVNSLRTMLFFSCSQLMDIKIRWLCNSFLCICTTLQMIVSKNKCRLLCRTHVVICALRKLTITLLIERMFELEVNNEFIWNRVSFSHNKSNKEC